MGPAECAGPGEGFREGTRIGQNLFEDLERQTPLQAVGRRIASRIPPGRSAALMQWLVVYDEWDIVAEDWADENLTC